MLSQEDKKACSREEHAFLSQTALKENILYFSLNAVLWFLCDLLSTTCTSSLNANQVSFLLTCLFASVNGVTDVCVCVCVVCVWMCVCVRACVREGEPLCGFCCCSQGSENILQFPAVPSANSTTAQLLCLSSDTRHQSTLNGSHEMWFIGGNIFFYLPNTSFFTVETTGVGGGGGGGGGRDTQCLKQNDESEK